LLIDLVLWHWLDVSDLLSGLFKLLISDLSDLFRLMPLIQGEEGERGADSSEEDEHILYLLELRHLFLQEPESLLGTACHNGSY